MDLGSVSASRGRSFDASKLVPTQAGKQPAQMPWISTNRATWRRLKLEVSVELRC